MKNLRRFKTESDYDGVSSGFTYPTVSYTEENNKVGYKPKPVVLVYKTTSINQLTKIVGDAELFKTITIEGIKQDVSGTGTVSYIFKTPGLYEVEIEWKDEITSVNNTFANCSGLTGSIPSGLFDNCTLVTNFVNTFANCSGLTGSIPSGLFDNCPLVTNFSLAFFNCSGLTSIPSGLFDNCPKVTSFNQTFDGCTGLTGTTPTTNGVELWHRDGKEGYPNSIDGSNCFDGCTKLANYSSIPDNWKI